MRAVIPVAGVGTRLRPHTYSLPKVLLNVAGKPILGHILDEIRNQGIKKATIITGYLGKLVEEYVTERYTDIQFDFVLQEKRLGLGHAIWIGREHYGKEPLMIILGDTIFDVDLKKAFISGNNSIGVKEVDDPRRFGVVVTNNGNKIQKLVEKPENPISNLAIVGLYHITQPEMLIDSLNELIDKDIKTRGEYQLTDALQLMIDKGAVFDTFNVDGWHDCGKRETLLATNRFLLEQKPSSQVNDNSIVIPPVFISGKASVQNSVIGPYASIAEGAVVKDSIIKNSIISYNAKVSSSLLEESIIGNSAELHGHFQKLNIGDQSQIYQT